MAITQNRAYVRLHQGVLTESKFLSFKIPIKSLILVFNLLVFPGQAMADTSDMVMDLLNISTGNTPCQKEQKKCNNVCADNSSNQSCTGKCFEQCVGGCWRAATGCNKTGNFDYDYSKNTKKNTKKDDFVEQKLKNWGTFNAAKGKVRICIRDHECEDGDKLQVQVNGLPYTEELFNKHSCREFTMRQGRNSIDILAVNGTGYKGRCDFSDVNTGEISVMAYKYSGGSIVPGYFKKQFWKLRAKAGSRSKININVK